MMESHEASIVDLQLRITEQEACIDELNIAAARQQQQLDDVVLQLEQVQLILRELVDGQQGAESGGGSGHEIPPHY